MNKKQAQWFTGIAAILVSYGSALAGSEVTTEGLIIWHTFFSILSGIGGFILLIVSHISDDKRH